MYTELTQEELTTVNDRGKVYGDPVTGAKNTGKVWAAMLNQRYGVEIEAIEPDMIHLMLAAMKIIRLSQSPGHPDSTLDARVYVQLAKHAVDILNETRPVNPHVEHQ